MEKTQLKIIISSKKFKLLLELLTTSTDLELKHKNI